MPLLGGKMLGFFIGTVCLIGFLKLARLGRRRHGGYGRGCGGGHGYGGYGGGPDEYGGGFGGEGPGADWAGGGPFGGEGRGGPFGRWFVMRRLFARLETTPAQEKVIKSAFDDLRAAATRVRSDAKAARPEVANAIRQEQFDETLFGEISHKIDEAAQAMRRATIDAIAKVHAVLDERQKKLLAELVESGPGVRRWGGGGGPYRQGVSL
jgi:Spy/CpxP family protein refolding chaperone